MEKLTEEQMWDIIDGLASPEILAQHELLMKEDAEYNLTFSKCAVLQQQLLKLDLEQPSMRFTQNVLDCVLPKVKTEVKPDRAPMFFLVAMLVLSVFMIVMIFKLPASSASGVPTEGVFSIFSNTIFTNIFLVINLFLVFIILDKKILRPYFQKKLSTK